MPKIVERAKRKEEVAEAAWRVIRRDGMEHASVRSIAQEAGLSAGAMRHYFATQSELLAFSMNLVSERVKKRIAGIRYTGNPFDDILLLLFELLPVDEEKRAEMEVWTSFTVKSLTDPTLHTLSKRVYDELRTGIVHIIESLVAHRLAPPDLQRELEVERLYALIDGLAMHRLIQPEQMTPETLQSVMRHHLESICRRE